VSDRGLLYILCGPSGVGKTTLAHHLLELHPELGFSVSYTTRAPRPGEEDGADYHFVSDAEFDEMIDAREFAEWAEVHGNRYGTASTTITEAWKNDRNVIFDIDFQGARQLQSAFPEETVSVLITPPSFAELERRLRGRETDSEAVIQRRLEAARQELEQWSLYDYLVENAELDLAKRVVDAIYLAATHRQYLRAENVIRLLAEQGQPRSTR
jgi:guanylate kinase